MDFDELLVEHIGEFGRYQKVLYFTLCLVAIPAAVNNLGIVFIAAAPNHWCHTPELDSFNISDEARWNLTLPLEEKDGEWTFSKCQFYNRSFVGWSEEDLIQEAASRVEGRNFSIQSCQRGWQYDHSRYESTIVTEWDLVCDYQLLQATAASVYMAGLMLGVVVFGQVSDWVGRKMALCVSVVLMVGFNIGEAFATSYTIFIVLRFLVAVSTISVFTVGFVFGMEIVGPSWRVFAGLCITFFWASAYMAVAGVAYFIRTWRTLQLVFACPLAVLLLYIIVLPESPRWLYAKQKISAAEKVIKRMAKVNKRKLPETFKIRVKKDENKGSFLDLFRTKRMVLQTSNLAFNWFVNSVVYYGLSLNTSNLGGDPYINFLIGGAVEVPAYALCFLVLPKLGRRWSMSSTMVIGGLALLATIPVPSEMTTLIIVLSMIGKFTITMSFGCIYVFTAELLPTVVRNIGIGICSLWARVGGICAPYIGQLANFSGVIPPVIFGVMSVAAGLLVLLLPETKGKKLPETIEEGENFGLATKIHKDEDTEMFSPDKNHV